MRHLRFYWECPSVISHCAGFEGGTKLGCNAVQITIILRLAKLKELILPHCQIPPSFLDIILTVFSSCIELTHLNLSGYNLETKRNSSRWSNQSMECQAKLKRNRSESLFNDRTNLQGNSVCFGRLLVVDQSSFVLYSLQGLDISQTELNRDDLLHLTRTIFPV